MAQIDEISRPDVRNGQVERATAMPFRLLQFTDLHLFGTPAQRLLGQDTQLTLQSVLDLAQAKSWPADAIVLTGDLVHDGEPAAYRFLRQRFGELGVPYHCLPGNHDCLDLVVGHLDEHAASALRVVRADTWDLLLLDSILPGEEGGHISDSVLAGLAAHRLAGGGRPTLVFLHHHLQPLGSRWIDTMQVDNGAAVLGGSHSTRTSAPSSAAMCTRMPISTALACGSSRRPPPAFSSCPAATILRSTPARQATAG